MKKIFFLFLIICLPLIGAAPVTDLTISLLNPPGIVNKDLNFLATWTGGDVNVAYWKFDSDGNVTNSAEVTTLFTDDFTDGDYTNNPTWTVGSGTFTATNADLNGTTAGYISLEYDSNYDYSSGIHLEATIKSNNSNGFPFYFGTSPNYTSSDFNGYHMSYQESTKQLFFQNVIEGTNTNTLGSPYSVDLNAGSKIELDRDNAGVWTISINGSVLDSGIDTNHTIARFYGVRATQNNFTIDNFLINDTGVFNITEPHSQVHNFLLGGNKTIYLTIQNSDGNASTSLNLNLPLDKNAPTIYLHDINTLTGFFNASIDLNANFGIGCSDANSALVDMNIIIGDINVTAVSVVPDTNIYVLEKPITEGTQNVKFNCVDAAGNKTTITQSFNVFSKLFYFVTETTGQEITSSTEYVLADINSLKAYSYSLQTYKDMFADGDVNLFYVGIQDDGIEFRIGYTDPAFPYVTRSFDLSVLDVNSVPVCFSRLESLYQQLFYSSVERQIRLKNAHTGCYHIAAITDFAFSDNYSISAWVIPQSYYLYLVTDSNTTQLALIDGSTEGSINLDSLILKQQFAQEIIITAEGATIAKTCSAGIDDCNTFTITYFNAANNNESVLAEIYNNTTKIYSYTETTSPNNFTITFDSTSLDFDANILQLSVTATRLDSTTKNFIVYFTPTGQVGYIHPIIVLLISFAIFLTGITLVSFRILFGWFGAAIAMIALAVTTFSAPIWYITFMQSILLIMLLYIGIVSYRTGQLAV